MRLWILLVCAVLVGLAAGCGGGGGGGAESPAELAKDAASGITISGLPSAVPAGVTLTVAGVAPATITAPAPTGWELVAAAACGPTGTTFTSPVTIKFPVATGLVAGEPVKLYELNAAGTAWGATGVAATVAADAKSASGAVGHFSKWGLFKEKGISLPDANIFMFVSGEVLPGGAPPDMTYQGSTQELRFPHAAAFALPSGTSYGGLTKAPFVAYARPDYTAAATAGKVLVVRANVPGVNAVKYYKMVVLTASASAVTFKYAQIDDLPVGGWLGRWEYTGSNSVGVLPGAMIDITLGSTMYAIDGNWTDASHFAGTFTTWPGGTPVKGAFQATLTLVGGKLNISWTAAAPMGNGSLTGGTKA